MTIGDPQECAQQFENARELSPRRATTNSDTVDQLVQEQLTHFGISPSTEIGQRMASLSRYLYLANGELKSMWQTTINELADMNIEDRVGLFNAKKFLCFQMAKMLDSLQSPLRSTYQSVVSQGSSRMAKGAYPMFDNVTAIFSASPVITKTATYIFACTEWINDAFCGREPLHEVYSRLLNPTSIALANHIVDLECGPRANEYMAWNFNSGMAAIDAILSHLIGANDVILCSRNIYGGAFQLIKDWYCKPSNLNVAVEWFDGYSLEEFQAAYENAQQKYADRLKDGRKIYTYIESPCNPHGYVLDVPAICKYVHAADGIVVLDSTVATPVLCNPLMRDDEVERPDYVMHSYTKDIDGHGNALGGCVIAKNERMFLAKHDSVQATDASGNEYEAKWDETMFWNVFYVKGAFLDADKAFDILTGSKTMEMRMIKKVVNTTVLAKFFDSHPGIRVHSNVLEDNMNSELRKKILTNEFPAPLFTIDFERAEVERTVFSSFFDNLEPMFGHQISLGQTNTIVLCPAITSHSEMNREELEDAGIYPTTIRVSIGDESPLGLCRHFQAAAKLAIDPYVPNFSDGFMSDERLVEMYQESYLDIHRRQLQSEIKRNH